MATSSEAKPEQRFCSACGNRLPGGARYCPGCGKSTSFDSIRVIKESGRALGEFAASDQRQPATSPPEEVEDLEDVEEPEWLYFQVRARQGEMATGKSFMRSLIGGKPALIRTYFDLWSEDGLGDSPVWGVQCLISAGQTASLENLYGMERDYAQEALDFLDQGVIKAGARRVADGPHWYSHRFAILGDQLHDFFDRLPS